MIKYTNIILILDSGNSESWFPMSDNLKKNIIVVCGPTASGKTALAVSLALRYNAEIVSADSRQVYRGMDIGSGKDLREYSTSSGSVPYHLIDIADPSQIYTLYHYQRDCYSVLRHLLQSNRLPILAGGTGLYIEAVLKHYMLPNVPEDPLFRTRYMRKNKEVLKQELLSRDPHLFATTDLSSKKRIVRALEISSCNRIKSDSPALYDIPVCRPVILAIEWPRAVLIERIRRRLQQRFETGMVDEVKKLLSLGINDDRLVLFGMEYKHVVRYLRNEVQFDQMVEELFCDIRRLAKRQMTYFRGMQRRGLEMHWIESNDCEKAVTLLEKYFFNQ